MRRQVALCASQFVLRHARLQYIACPHFGQYVGVVAPSLHAVQRDNFRDLHCGVFVSTSCGTGGAPAGGCVAERIMSWTRPAGIMPSCADKRARNARLSADSVRGTLFSAWKTEPPAPCPAAATAGAVAARATGAARGSSYVKINSAFSISCCRPRTTTTTESLTRQHATSKISQRPTMPCWSCPS